MLVMWLQTVLTAAICFFFPNHFSTWVFVSFYDIKIIIRSTVESGLCLTSPWWSPCPPCRCRGPSAWSFWPGSPWDPSLWRSWEFITLWFPSLTCHGDSCNVTYEQINNYCRWSIWQVKRLSVFWPPRLSGPSFFHLMFSSFVLVLSTNIITNSATTTMTLIQLNFILPTLRITINRTNHKDTTPGFHD